jgi:hypothetical protein
MINKGKKEGFLYYERFCRRERKEGTYHGMVMHNYNYY